MVFNLNLPEQERQIYVIFITMGKLLFLYFGFIMNATWMQGKSSLP